MFGVLLSMTVLIAVSVIVWSKVRRSLQEAVATSAGRSVPAAHAQPRPNPQTLEGALTLQLVTGEISGRQYRHAMATVAARDAERHPLEVPPEAIPPEAA